MEAPENSSHYQSMSIATALGLIQANEIALPLLQRNFVWDIDRITKLFDSILQGYPISSMLFWQVPAASLDAVQMYAFIKNYTAFEAFGEGVTQTVHQERNRNQALPCSADTFPNGLLAVLDGQQRLTSLYMALCGTYASKEHRKRRGHLYNYPPQALFLCVSDGTPDADTLEDYRSNRYQLYWWSDGVEWGETPGSLCIEPIQLSGNNTEIWLHVGEVMHGSGMSTAAWVDQQLAAMHRVVDETEGTDITAVDFAHAKQTLERLHTAIFQEQYISYYLEQSPDLARAVETFIRVNNGGMQIGYADLLFSILSSEWKSRNAREEIERVEAALRRHPTGLNLEKGFILKAALVMAADRNLRFELGQFSSVRIKTMQTEWPRMAAALEDAAQVVEQSNVLFLTAPSLVLVLAFFHYKLAALERDLVPTPQDHARMVQWLKRAQLFWSSEKFSTETKLTHLIGILVEHFAAGHHDFPFERLVTESWGVDMRLAAPDRTGGFSVEQLLEKAKHEPTTKFVLGLLQPNVQRDQEYDVDHCYPSVEVYGADEWDEAHSTKSNSLANLQLLPGYLNKSKSGTPFDAWEQSLDALLTNPSIQQDLGVGTRADLHAAHFYPASWLPYEDGDDQPKRLLKFEDFFNQRRKMALRRLEQVFQDPA